MENKFKVGDIVRVKNWGKQYSTNIVWFKEYQSELSFDWIVRYAYCNKKAWGCDAPVDLTNYKILFIDDTGRALITEDARYAVHATYLIDVGGLEQYRIPMTQDDIEVAMGCRIELIGVWNNE